MEKRAAAIVGKPGGTCKRCKTAGRNLINESLRQIKYTPHWILLSL
jgi:hypothetical protein